MNVFILLHDFIRSCSCSPYPTPRFIGMGRAEPWWARGGLAFRGADISHLSSFIQKTFMPIINTSRSLHLSVDCINGPIFHPFFYLLPLTCNLAVSFCERSEIRIPGLSHVSFSIDQWDINRQSAGILVLLPLVLLPSPWERWDQRHRRNPWSRAVPAQLPQPKCRGRASPGESRQAQPGQLDPADRWKLNVDGGRPLPFYNFC